MSHSNPNQSITREVRFRQPQTLRASAPGAANKFLIAGQGVLIFKFKTPVTPGFSTELSFSNTDNTEGLRLILNIGFIKLLRYKAQNTQVLFETAKGLTTDKNAFWWVSLDANNHCYRFGVGEARLETMMFEYFFPSKDTGAFLQSLSDYNFNPAFIQPLRLLRDPVQQNVPLKVKGMDELTMKDIATSAFMPKANLNSIGQKLYENVAGEKFILNDEEFPDFAEAIEYNIATPGCWCYETLKDKSDKKPAGLSKQIYLRITLGQNGGESPGIPYVMEVWPPGSFSSIHNHAGANALIRVLHGEIKVHLYAYLGAAKTYNPEGAVFRKDDITWISPTLNQFHQLINPNPQGPTCITIQCYMYDADDTGHYGFFDYIGAEEKIESYTPGSDCDFMQFREIIREQWLNRKIV
ncbi:MAG: cysteine dioxygenase family protein [Bacteroidetes bacterium]|nr:cysteine dioxygenase family protein [Bacteroidota bacterium]